MKLSRGFTVIEILIVVTILALASILFFTQKSTVAAIGRDDARKTAINSMYHTLESVYYKDTSAYPRVLSAETLPTLQPDLLKDPQGVRIGEGESDYRYEPTGCTENNQCTGYTLRAILEEEDDFVKKSKN